MDFLDAYIFPAIFSIFIVFAVVLGIADLRADRRRQRDGASPKEHPGPAAGRTDDR